MLRCICPSSFLSSFLSSKPTTFHCSVMPSRPGPLSWNHPCFSLFSALGCEEPGPGPQPHIVETTRTPLVKTLKSREFDFTSPRLLRVDVALHPSIPEQGEGQCTFGYNGPEFRAVAQAFIHQLRKRVHLKLLPRKKCDAVDLRNDWGPGPIRRRCPRKPDASCSIWPRSPETVGVPASLPPTDCSGSPCGG